MSTAPTIADVCALVAENPWVRKTRVSSDLLRDIGVFAVNTNNALAAIREAATQAEREGGLLDPAVLLAFLADNNLMLTETGHGQDIDENQGSQPAGAANS